MTPYKMQNLVYEWVDFSKFGQIWAKIGSNLRKFRKKSVILFKIWPKIEPIGIWMGYFFLKNWYLYGSTFKFRGGTSLPKQNLSTPPPPGCQHTRWRTQRNKPQNAVSLLDNSLDIHHFGMQTVDWLSWRSGLCRWMSRMKLSRAKSKNR